MCHIEEMRIQKGAECQEKCTKKIDCGCINHYIVETTNFKTLYENDVPIYNKVLENEYLRVYRLKKALGGRLIKIKTDAVIVEGGNKIPHLISEKCVIGRVKPPRAVTIDPQKWRPSETMNTDVLELETRKKWNIIYETRHAAGGE